MKLIEKLNSKTYPAVTLYIDDLKVINDFLLSKSDRLTLNNKLYRFDSFDDFVNNSKESKELEFKVYDFSEKKIDVQLSINEYSAYLSTIGSDDEIGALIFIYIDKILSEKVGRKYFLLSTQTTFLYTIAGFYFMFDPLNFFHLEKPAKGMLGFAFILLGSISSRYAMAKSRIILKHKADHKNIYQRTKDDIFSNVTASLITAIIGFVAGVLAVKLGLIPAAK